MSARAKGKRKKPTFHGIGIKLTRAEVQLNALEREFDSIREAKLYSFLPEIYDEGRTHIYKAVNPPPVGQYWGAQIGEIAHSLRTALDHLAWQLVLAAGNVPNNRTQFPVCNTKPTRRVVKCLPYPRKREGLRISGKVPRRAFTIIEAVQPYNGTYEGLFIDAINSLDIFDKHRELIVTTTAVYLGSTHWDEDGRTVTMKFTGAPIEDGKVVAIVKYDPPQLEPDPNLEFTPYITFSKGGPFGGQVAFSFLWNHWAFLANDFFPRFDKWLPMKSS